MRVLLDTHIFLWFLNGDKRLTSRALKHIDAADEVYVSAASVWEAAIKSGLGKLDAQAAVLAAEITSVGFLELPVRAAHSIALQNLPLWHRDPFDRMLLAQAISESLQLLTADVQLRRYSPLVLRA